MYQTLPVLYKPTTTILIDDDELYIENIKALLPSSINSHIVTAKSLDSICENQLFAIHNEAGFKPFIASDIISKKISEVIPVSVIVIDHCMAPDDGLKILRKIKSPFVQKILISNFFKNDQAIEAFNQNIINAFICKMDPQFVNKLTHAIQNAQTQFFLQLSSMINYFFSDQNPLYESKAYEIFNQINKEYDLQYYQASQDLRKFNFFDHKGSNTLILEIISEDEIDDLINSYNADLAPPEVISLIEGSIALPCSKKYNFSDGKDCNNNLEFVGFFEGKKKYFYRIYKENSNDNKFI